MILDDVAALRQQSLRGTDINTLLRLHDCARAALATSRMRNEREQARRAARRIAVELERRKVRP